MKKNGIIILAVLLIGVVVFLIYRQSVESQQYYRKTGETFMYRYGGDIIGLIGNAINKKGTKQ